MAKIIPGFLLLSVLAVTFAQKPTFTNSIQRVSLELYKKLVAEHPQENVVINPINCFSTLALLYLGSEGETFDKMTFGLTLAVKADSVRTLIHPILENGDSESLFSISNNIFLAEGIETKPPFNQLADSFNVNLKDIHFTDNDYAINQINDWIKEKSSSALSNIVQPNYVIDSQTTALILNAVSFKGKWKLSYYDMQSHDDGEFWVHDDQRVKTPMISTTFHTQFKDFGNFTAISLPYKGTDLVMLVVLPKERYGLSDLEENLKFYDLQTIQYQLSETFENVRVQLPKFKSNFTAELRSPLSKNHLEAVFDESANFTSIGSKVKFNEFIHKMDFSMEEGEQDHKVIKSTATDSFVADHPFLYVIIAPTGIIYTMGRYIGPLDAKSKI